MFLLIPFVSAPAGASFSVASLTEAQQLFLCVVLATASACYDGVFGSDRFTPLLLLKAAFGGALVGAFVFFVTVEVSRVKPSWRLAVALTAGFAWKRVIDRLRQGAFFDYLFGLFKKNGR